MIMAASKLADRDRTRSQPLTLAALEEYGALSGLEPPAGEFDPQQTWKHAYRLWMVSSGGLAPRPADMHYRGFLEIDRKPLPDGGIALRVHQSVLQHAPAVHDTTVEMTCAADDLAGPRSWKLTHTVRDGRLQPVPEATVEQTGTLTNGSLRIAFGGTSATRSVELPAARATSNWSLFDAVGRLPRKKMPPLEFAMLHELDQIKESQRITYRGPGEHTLGGNTVMLHAYQHRGRGILPYSYYTDEQGRLLLAIGGLRAYILDSRVRQLHEQCLAWISERAKR
jgi:hypothetical protein